ncbi:MAG: hypothetical protein UR26_C0002G0075 [candidate division TM6 bacterium GW2011_GWF2_32_72]|nr:MAG: hypothetical protein UR26_C0002G0075 [candidate division TM6 bacterium GW2011_GWF2_32_72]
MIYEQPDYINRRKKLGSLIQEKYQVKNGNIILFANLENERTLFSQESSFFYYTGINEPGAVLIVDLNGYTTLFIPNFDGKREAWMSGCIDLKSPQKVGVDEIKLLGDSYKGIVAHPFFTVDEYNHLIEFIKNSGLPFFSLLPDLASSNFVQKFLLNRLISFLSELGEKVRDISSLIYSMRRKKDATEMVAIIKAIEITHMGFDAAKEVIRPGGLESEVKAAMEYIFTSFGAQSAFPTIAASGKNATILHYTKNLDELSSGDLLLIDAGAEFNHYCADISRTFAISEKMTPRQKELFNVVQDTKEYIESLAKPGMYLNNNLFPENSLSHLAMQFFAKYGLEKYFTHGIGHYLGLDVHDVGSSHEALSEGDVITIEPGLYIKEESIGIRLEDDYQITKNGCVCLSDLDKS